ncbi:ABC transporter permease subunit [Clostridium sp. MCC353]|uniref:ABC transporter permease n=1 Tax=Clostridium sp. MCC353 TaxID=2592646 RepID=UPI001C013551|nr:iron ABC transporter permease [Clostridium sp. MCC353]MBT9777024.1 ABC transporter permease subunit [Clostridium sp. MCC353]
MSKMKKKMDFWTAVTIIIAALFILFLIYPLFSLFLTGFQNPETGQFTMDNFIRFFRKKYYYQTLFNSLKIAVCVTCIAIVTGSALAYFMSFYKIHFSSALEILIIISMLSPPFIGAYSWILLLGRSGAITVFFKNVFGITTPSIYGFGGIVLVMTLKLFPFIFLYVSGALKKVDASLVEASSSLGCGALKNIYTIILPLVLPTLLAGSLLVFMNALGDFGTPRLIGEGFQVMPVVIYNEFVSEVGGTANFSAALATILVLITAVLFLIQKYVVNRLSFTMSSMRPIARKAIHGWKSAVVHLLIYFVVFLALLPQITVIFTSFLKTQGSRFLRGFTLDSYRAVFKNLSDSISNTLVFGAVAITIVVLLGIFISYISVRRRNAATGFIDMSTMFPYILPGSVLGITLLLAFNKKPLLLSGTTFIIILAYVIRRLPYTLRSSAAILYQISPSMEEASISLGCSPLKTFFKITVVLMLPGVFSGAVLSWITIINELSASLILYTGGTRTMSVAIYTEVLRSGYGTAAAMSTVLTAITVLSLVIFFKLSGRRSVDV